MEHLCSRYCDISFSKSLMPDFIYFLYDNISCAKNQDFLENFSGVFNLFCILHRYFFQESPFFVNLYHDSSSYRTLCTILCFLHASGHTLLVCLQAPHAESAWNADSSQQRFLHRQPLKALWFGHCSRRAS